MPGNSGFSYLAANGLPLKVMSATDTDYFFVSHCEGGKGGFWSIPSSLSPPSRNVPKYELSCLRSSSGSNNTHRMKSLSTAPLPFLNMPIYQLLNGLVATLCRVVFEHCPQSGSGPFSSMVLITACFTVSPSNRFVIRAMVASST